MNIKSTIMKRTIYFLSIITFIVTASCMKQPSNRDFVHPEPATIDSNVVLPPAWSFGVLYGGYTNQQETIDRIKKIQAHDYPIDAYWIDSWFWDYQNHGMGPDKYMDFVGDTVSFPNRENMWSFMENNNIKGGFWVWDPVENASFMPWLLAAALLHSAIVVEKREALKSWTILLAILAFGFSLIGTFIVRSGLLTSVHAFANDPERGVFILMIMIFFTGGALTLFAARASRMEAKGVFGVASRESALVANNILLAVSCFVVFIGTMWPVVAEMFFDTKLSVGAPFFNMAFTPFMVVLGLLLPLGSMLSWKRAKVGRAFKQLLPGFILSVLVLGLFWTVQTGNSLLGPVGMFLGTWIVSGAVLDLVNRLGQTRDWSRLFRLPRSDWGKATAHIGFGITMVGIAGLMAWEQEDIRVAQIGEPFQVGDFELELTAVNEVRGPNYFSTMGDVIVRQDGEQIAVLNPEKRNYPVAQMPTTEAAIDYRVLRDLYVVIGDEQDNGGWVMRTYIKPLANWIWAGSILMALGGTLSLSDRRYRVAAGTRRQAAEPSGVPAE